MTVPDDASLTPEQRRELFAEWQEDYQAARAREYGAADAATYEERVEAGVMMPPVSEPPHPWPSEIARENKRPAVGQQQGKSNEKTQRRDDGHCM
jgi:hypothetical protein